MLALATGWTPDVIGALPVQFRASCHWAMYAEALVGPEGLPPTSPPSGASQAVRQAYAQVAADVLRIRSLLYPDDV